MIVRLLLALALLLGASPAWSGSACRIRNAAPQAAAEAAASALRIAAVLEQQDAPVALLARAGTDLSKHGLHYSHLGFVLRDHPNGRWTVIHLLNRCGTTESRLYAEGLVNFFADELVSQDARVIWLQPQQAERLTRRLQGDDIHRLHQSRYNLIAHPASGRFQNSTSWALEVLAALGFDGEANRVRAQGQLAADGFRPDLVHIAYAQRVAGGLFASNVVFTDHPIATRIAGDYPVVTVRSILRFLDRQGLIYRQWEWRQGRVQDTPGPA